MSTFEPILNNPTLGYRLDPYEPGLLRQAKASQSTAQVVSQEHRNLTRLCRQAIEEDRIVIRKQITYRPTIAGSYMGTAAGRTTVLSMEKTKPEHEDPSMERGKLENGDPSKEPESGQENLPPDFMGEGGETVYTSGQPELARLSVEELTQEEQMLRIEIRRITTEMERVEREKPDESAPLQEEQDQGELRLEMEEKRQELRKVILAKISKSQSELLASLTGALADTFQAPVSMLKAAYNASSSPAGENFDMFI